MDENPSNAQNVQNAPTEQNVPNPQEGETTQNIPSEVQNPEPVETEQNQEEADEDQQFDEEEQRSKENEEKLKDFTTVIDEIYMPLQTKEEVKKALRKFKMNINDSFQQIKKNKSLEELKILQRPEDIKESHYPLIAERVSKWIKQIDDAQKEFMETSVATTALEEIALRKTKVSNCSIIAQQLKDEKFTNAIIVLDKSEEKSTGENFKKNKIRNVWIKPLILNS